MMSDWKSWLLGDPTDWLLEKDNPSWKDLTLTDVLDRPKNDAEVTEARQEIMERGVVPQIMAKLILPGNPNPDGNDLDFL
jgi:hypothetical protein